MVEYPIDMKVKDKVAIVTGAKSGIGFATASRFAIEGAKVVLADINDCHQEANRLKEQGADTHFVRVDVSNAAQVDKLFEQTLGTFGRLDILINNAGIELATVDLLYMRQIMPLAKIEVRKPRPADEIAEMIEAIYQAQRDALKVPDGDRQIRYVEHKPEHFSVPPGKTENYTLVEITLFPGRSLEAKRKLYQSIVRRFGNLGIDPADIFIVLNEPPLDNWGIQGGSPASEVDLGFKLNV